MTTDLNGRTALVTGGASGIGAATARALAAAGAHVTIADINGEAAQVVATEIGGEVWQVDMSDTAALAEVSLQTDILVNNAGIQHISPIEKFDPAKFHLILSLMLEAPFLLIRASLPHMYANGFGRVVNLSSAHGLRASAFKSAYVSAKHGLEGLSKVTALEGGPHGVTSNCVNPGYVRTPLVEKQIADQALRARHPRVRGGREGHAHRERDQVPGRADRGRRPGALAVRRHRPDGHRCLVHDGRRLDRELVPATPSWLGAAPRRTAHNGRYFRKK